MLKIQYLEGEIEIYSTLNKKDTEREDFMSLDLLCLSSFVIATDAGDHKQRHIQFCHHRSQTGHYFFIEDAEKINSFLLLFQKGSSINYFF